MRMIERLNTLNPCGDERRKINELVEAVNELQGMRWVLPGEFVLAEKKCYPKSGNLSPGEYMQAAHASSCECEFCKPKPSTLAERLKKVYHQTVPDEMTWNDLSVEAKRFFKEIIEECYEHKHTSPNVYDCRKDELLRRIEEA